MSKLLTIPAVILVATGAAVAGDTKSDPPKPPTLPAELAAMGKAMAGTWTCTGQGLAGGMKLAAMTATSKWSVEMGGWWIHESFGAKIGDEIGHSFESYT